jgi:hypothetical protein
VSPPAAVRGNLRLVKNPEARLPASIRNALLVLSLVLAVCAAVLPAARDVLAQPAKPAAAATAGPTCDDARRASIKGTVSAEHARLDGATFWWSAAVGVTQYGSIVLSLLAAFFVKTDWLGDRSKNVTTVLTSISALFITASTAGGFHEKWQANRTAAYRAKALLFELDKSSANCDAVLTELQDVMRTANDSIVTAGTGTKPVATE